MSKRKVLIITSTYDKTVDMIISRFSSTIDFFRFDVDNMLAYDIFVSTDFFRIQKLDAKIDSSSCKSIYYRKPSNIQLQKIFDSPYDQFATKELFTLVEGIAEIFDGRCLTRPSIMKLASNKVYQGKVAKNCGFLQPTTVITNKIENLALIKSHEIIVKPLSVASINFSKHKEIVQTNIYNPAFEAESLVYTSAIFQSYQNKDFEVRLTIINGFFYSVAIKSKNLIDWRKDGADNEYKKIETPEDIKIKCLEYMKIMNMDFGCFDFIVNNHDWFFLEMNVNGQWGWLEILPEIDISTKIVEYLNV